VAHGRIGSKSLTGVAVYMEGGGDGKDSKAALRQGMEVFLAPLKDAVSARSWRWRLVCCGGRNAAFDGFRNAVQIGDDAVVALLVDAEALVNGAARAHLQARDGWDLEFASDQAVHLMVQTMEAWIVADPDALAKYYGQSFRKSALPRTQNLETIGKDALAASLDSATRNTQKGAYHKIRHAGDLLKLINQSKVQRRCPACRRMLEAVGQAIREHAP
jgi:Domain of unknown function (DUF4276)